jgi:hypothetical protein
MVLDLNYTIISFCPFKFLSLVVNIAPVLLALSLEICIKFCLKFAFSFFWIPLNNAAELSAS